MSLAKTLAELRREANFTQGELGKKLNITAQAISKWENGTSEPDITTLKKLADIYNVSISYIIDSENASRDGENISTQDAAPAQDALFDVYLTEIASDKLVVTVAYLRQVLGLGLAEASDAAHCLPYCISGKVDAETGRQIANNFAELGATVALEPCGGLQAKRIKSLAPPAPPKETHDMRRRFIVANITAGLPAIAVLILSLMKSGGFGAAVLSVYVAVCTYSLIFLLWYPTLTRKLLTPILKLPNEGFFTTIGSGLVFLLLLPWLIAVGLISPIVYAFSIKTRIQRMREEDLDDDVFFDPYDDNF